MKRWLAIAAYQCRINGGSSDSIDFRVRYFNLPTSAKVEKSLCEESVHAYTNDLGEVVSWPLVKICAIEELSHVESGGEVVGFIVNSQELASLGQRDAAQQIVQADATSWRGLTQVLADRRPREATVRVNASSPNYWRILSRTRKERLLH